MTNAHPKGGAAKSGLRENRDWRLLWLGQTASIMGDAVLDITLVLWVTTVIARNLSWAPIAVGCLMVGAAAPALLLGPVAGVFADRWDRRRIMLVADLSRALLLIALLPFAWPSVSDRLSRGLMVAIICAVVVAASCFAQFFNPCRFALLGAVVPEEDQARANGQFQVSSSLCSIFGPVLAAPLLFTLGVQWALIIDALSYIVSYYTIRAMRVTTQRKIADLPTEQPVGFWSDFRSGIRFFFTNQALVALGVGAVVATLGIGAVSTLDVFFVTHNLHAPAKWLGFLNAAEGIGAVAGAFVAGRVASKFAAEKVFWISLVVAGCVFLAYSRTEAVVTASIVLACGGVVASVISVVVGPLLLRETPADMTGRTFGVINLLQQAALVVSMGGSGYLAGTVLRGFHQTALGLNFGPYDIVFVVAGVLFILAGLLSVGLLRHVRAENVIGEETTENRVTAE